MNKEEPSMVRRILQTDSLFIKYLLSVYYMTDAILGSRITQ